MPSLVDMHRRLPLRWQLLYLSLGLMFCLGLTTCFDPLALASHQVRPEQP